VNVKLDLGQCLKVECDGEEAGIIRTRHGWALAKPTEDKGRTIQIQLIAAPGYFYRIDERWSDL
jgi:hypothetical protein